MTITPPEKEKTEDVVLGPFIPLREPPGRLGAIVRRMKRMASLPPPPLPHNLGDAATKQDAE